MDRADLLDTAASTTIVPTQPDALDLQRALGLLRQISTGADSVRVTPGPVLGEGGMGVVREAEQVSLGRRVAIKTLKAGRRDPSAARDLLREAWITGSLEHPNVVPVHQLGIDEDGSPVLVLKRVEGVGWNKLIRDEAEVRRRFGVTDMLAWNIGILMHVLNAVRFAHSRGILHRDLKPTNVMIGDFGEVYLLDWGIAVSLREDPTGRLPLAADATEVAGTPCYMAPEMLEPQGKLSERTDVYLSGAVLFEIIACRPPHEGATALEVLSSVLSSNPQLPADAPAELASICTRALAPDPAQRFESVEAFRLALQSYLEHRGSDLILTGARARLDELAATLASTPVDRERHREDIYRLFGAARFGFHESLAAWRDNAAARTGLARATIAVAEYELASGDPQTAVTLLSELDEPPSLLEKARAAAAEQASRREKLEQLDRAHDLEVERTSRGALALTLGVMFTIAPFVASLVPLFQTHFWYALWSAVALTTTGTWSWIHRAKLSTTIVNRRLVATGVFTFGTQTTLVLMMWWLGASIAYTNIAMLFLYTLTVGMAAIAIDPKLAVSAIGFLAGALVTARFRDHGLHVMTVVDFVFALNVLWYWRIPVRDAPSA
ncbi:MAG TPA: serine/threonine-protein kinase [Kofleriaceae bacterium]|nr:serine/threonine-protein kinase [Kofleriaceae bacterium]